MHKSGAICTSWGECAQVGGHVHKSGGKYISLGDVHKSRGMYTSRGACVQVGDICTSLRVSAKIHERFLKFLANWEGKKKNNEGIFLSPCHDKGVNESFDIGEQKVGVAGGPNSDIC